MVIVQRTYFCDSQGIIASHASYLLSTFMLGVLLAPGDPFTPTQALVKVFLRYAKERFSYDPDFFELLNSVTEWNA